MFKRTAALILSVIFITCSFVFVGCKREEVSRTTYDINVTLTDNILSGEQTVNYYNDTETAISVLKFNLYGNAYRKDAKFSPVSAQHVAQSYPNGFSYGDMKINNVTCGGEKLNFEVCGQDLNILQVELGKEIFPDERISVKIDYTLSIAKVVSRTGINEHTINLANFYPILCARDENGFYECVYYSTGDPFYSDHSDYRVTLTADKKYVVAASGKNLSNTENGSTVTSVYEIENALSFCFVLSDKFSVLKSNKSGVDIYYYYYDDENPNSSMEYAEKCISYFSKTFGEYAYSQYTFVETEFVQGGMEFSALTMISDDLSAESFGEVIVHETAHQWWQTAVSNNEIEYGFLDEGLTEYSVVLFYENHPEYSLSRAELIKSAEDTYRIFCTVSDKVFGSVDTRMLRSLKDFKSEYEYVNLAYVKPCIMYDYLRTTIGDKRFFKSLKDYYEKYKFDCATPYDLVGVFEKSGADTNGFFQSFFDGKVII
ncbi:MAG: M1 family metallopeptidase [Clostridiales bacterium]|nr:M1 family metallopeptidase [Clostridiales bacterium]